MPADTMRGEGGSRPLALITGGHRRLGGHIAAKLAHAGYDLALHGSSDATPDAALKDALISAGSRWAPFVADFLTDTGPLELLETVTGHFGRAPDVLINGASLFGQDQLATVTPDDLISHYRVGCSAAVLITQAFVSAAPEQGGRSIINILDQRLLQPHGDQLAYSLAKYALAGFTQTAARTLSPHIRVNAVAPGLTLATPDYDAAAMARIEAMMPLQILPSPDDIAAAVLYLINARAVTGQTLYVDGGAHMQSYPRDFMHI